MAFIFFSKKMKENPALALKKIWVKKELKLLLIGTIRFYIIIRHPSARKSGLNIDFNVRIILLCNNIKQNPNLHDDWYHSVKHLKLHRFLLLDRQCGKAALQASRRHTVHPMPGVRCHNRTEWDFIHHVHHLLTRFPPLLRIQLLDATNLSQMVLHADGPFPWVLFPWIKLHYLHIPVRYRLPMHGLYVKKACSLHRSDTRSNCHDSPQLLHMVGDHPWWSP